MSDRIAQLEKLLAAEPDDAFCLYGLAQEYAAKGDHEQALAFFDRTIVADPTSAYAYFHKARILEADDDIAGARSTLEAGLVVARTAGDSHAASEIQGALDLLDD